MNRKSKNLISILVAVILVAASSRIAFADHCESTYGGGEKCVYNKRFSIDKDVRIIESDGEEGDWEEDKVTGVKENETVEFRIRIKNLSDEEAGSFDDMEMKDFLPDELIMLDDEGLTEEWDDFDAGEDKTFTIEVKIDPDEFDRDEDFDKCVVNKAEVRWKGKFESADTATVCYGDEEPKELPKTGSTSSLAILGFGLLTSGVLAKFVRKYTKSR